MYRHINIHFTINASGSLGHPRVLGKNWPINWYPPRPTVVHSIHYDDTHKSKSKKSKHVVIIRSI